MDRLITSDEWAIYQNEITDKLLELPLNVWELISDKPNTYERFKTIFNGCEVKLCYPYVNFPVFVVDGIDMIPSKKVDEYYKMVSDYYKKKKYGQYLSVYNSIMNG